MGDPMLTYTLLGAPRTKLTTSRRKQPWCIPVTRRSNASWTV